MGCPAPGSRGHNRRSMQHIGGTPVAPSCCRLAMTSVIGNRSPDGAGHCGGEGMGCVATMVCRRSGPSRPSWTALDTIGHLTGGTMSRNIQTVETYLDGFRKNDHAQILSCLTDDIEWTVFGYFHLVGKQAYNDAIDGQG